MIIDLERNRGLLCLAVASLFAGCGASVEDPRGTRVAAEGTVKLDGAELAAGRIVFLSNQGEGTVKATALVEQGRYSFDEDNGPLPGTARVEIYPIEMDLEEFEKTRGGDATQRVPLSDVWIPARYNTHSTLTAEVGTDAEENVDTFALQTD